MSFLQKAICILCVLLASLFFASCEHDASEEEASSVASSASEPAIPETSDAKESGENPGEIWTPIL